MAKDRRSKITILKQSMREKYDAICMQIKELEAQKAGIIEMLALIPESKKEKEL